MYCVIGSVGCRGGIYDVHMMIFPMFVGVFIARVLVSVVGICMKVKLFLMKIATPEHIPSDL